MSVSPPPAPGAAGGRRDLLAVLGPLAVIVLGAVLRFRALGAKPVWTDEGSAWTAASLPVNELLHRCVSRDASPPLFYLVTKLALALGDDEWHLRLFPAVCSVALVWLTYRIARLGLGRGYATLAAFLLAISPYQVMYAQEARTYTPAAAFMVGAMYVYARLQQSPGPQRWLPLVLFNAAGLWTQSLAALGIAAQGLLSVLTPTGRRRFWPWAGAVAAACLLYVPWVLASRAMAGNLGHSHWYIPPSSAHGVFNILRAALLSPFPLVTAPPISEHPGLGHYMPGALAYALITLPVLAALLPTLRLLPDRSARGFVARLCWVAWLAPVLLVFAVSLKQSLLLARYFVFLGPYVAVLFALGLSQWRWRPARGVILAVLVATSAMGLFRYEHDYRKERWREVTARIRSIAAPGRTAVLVPFDADPLAFYLRDGRSGIRVFEVRHHEQPFSATFTPRQLDEVEAQLRRESREYDEVWVIIRSAWSPERGELARRTLAVAAEGRARAEHTEWPAFLAALQVTRFVRADSAFAGQR